jgi:metal-responsive CopG/Arc/MetJ family transcriptional regulator
LTSRITLVILPCMKTAISIPDALFQEAEQFAQSRGLSRSELYVRALQLYLQTYRQGDITSVLNAIYAEEDVTVNPGFIAAQTSVLLKEEW